ncbi:MAG: endonuclease III [Nitrospirae bacterium]|nr:MAG: endonuclease III [Nitrospirota bacterium]
MHDRDIHTVVRILKQECTKWREPIVGVIANQSQDPFRILISCLLSLRTKDQTTAEASHRLFALASDPASILALPLHRLEQAIYPVGFYRTKAKQIRRLCQTLLDDFNGRVPDCLDQLLTLPGVGRKTANLVVTLGYRKPGICVDTHVHRICNRWGYIHTKTPNETEQALRQKLPRRYWIHFNDWLVPFGQNLCRPVSPLCSQCPIRPWCQRVGVTRSR